MFATGTAGPGLILLGQEFEKHVYGLGRMVSESLVALFGSAVTIALYGVIIKGRARE